MKIKKQLPIPTLIGKIIDDNTINSAQELHLHTFSFPGEAILDSFTSLTFSVHSSSNLLTNSFLHLQFS